MAYLDADAGAAREGQAATAGIEDLAVSTAKLAALAVTAGKIGADAVTTAKILDANVTAGKLATDAVETAKIAALAVTAAKLASDAVETAKIAAGAVTAAKLATTLKTGYISLPLTGMRVVAANDVVVKGADDGGVLSKDTAPLLERVNGATDKRLRIKWAAASEVEIILGSFAYPPDLDDAAAITVKVLAKMSGAADTPVLAISYFEGTGDTNAGGNTAACSAAEAVKSVTIAAGDVGAVPKSATVGLTPAAHGTDSLDIYAAWIEYTRA